MYLYSITYILWKIKIDAVKKKLMFNLQVILEKVMPRLRRELEKAKGKIGDRSEVRIIVDEVDAEAK